MSTPTDRGPTGRGRGMLVAALFACLALALAGVSAAPGQDLQSRLDAKEAELEGAEARQGVLSTEIARYSEEIDVLIGEVATLRNREAVVQAELDETQERLNTERHYLNLLRGRLNRSLQRLGERLVEIYKSDQPDALTVILQSDGFDDLLERYTYLDSIQEQDAAIAHRIHGLRDETRQLVESIRGHRDEVEARKEELERTRVQLEARQSELDASRDAKAGALDAVEGSIQRLEGDISSIQDDIQAQIQAAQASVPAPALPAGPIQGESSSGFIWPVNGPVVSPFGPRWGRMHEGIDIAAPAGTPIRAVADGTVILIQSDAASGGYGNFTCVGHSSSLSSCYAHQSSFATSSGASVRQGEMIGYVGCTGHCFGDHLHFEVRVGGAPVDPMGYL